MMSYPIPSCSIPFYQPISIHPPINPPYFLASSVSFTLVFFLAPPALRSYPNLSHYIILYPVCLVYPSYDASYTISTIYPAYPTYLSIPSISLCHMSHLSHVVSMRPIKYDQVRMSRLSYRAYESHLKLIYFISFFSSVFYSIQPLPDPKPRATLFDLFVSSPEQSERSSRRDMTMWSSHRWG
jgi:hypothetical protein